MAESPVKGLDQSPKRLARRAEAADLLKAKDKLGVPKLTPDVKNAVFDELKTRAREAGKKAEEIQNADPFTIILDKLRSITEDPTLQKSYKDNLGSINGINGAISIQHENLMSTIKDELAANGNISEKPGMTIPVELSVEKLPDAIKIKLYQEFGLLQPNEPLSTLDQLPQAENREDGFSKKYPRFRVEANGFTTSYCRVNNLPDMTFSMTKPTGATMENSWSNVYIAPSAIQRIPAKQ